jgi:hypothetical protein
MNETPLHPESDEERKRRERAAFEAYFVNERIQEEKRNRTAITWVIIIGVAIPAVFTILYFFVVLFAFVLSHGR